VGEIDVESDCEGDYMGGKESTSVFEYRGEKDGEVRVAILTPGSFAA
jgi:hypothetical protein